MVGRLISLERIVAHNLALDCLIVCLLFRNMTSLYDQLRLRMPQLRMTPLLIVVNVIVLAMLFNGAGLWHSQNGVQLAGGQLWAGNAGWAMVAPW
jgi:hypothetical protein